VGLTWGRLITFVSSLLRSRRKALDEYRQDPPQIVLAMGGFTSAGPVLAARRSRAACFLHDSNVIPGRANRWLARFADEVYVAFEETQARFKTATRVTGTPVRSEFHSVDRDQARVSLGLRVADPVLLVMGGSQGAEGINRLMQEALPALVERFPRLQFIHLTGTADLTAVQATYRCLGVPVLVREFCAEMHLALGAATLAVSRAGGSSIAELAATITPAVLIPYPAASDRHQQFNAAALSRKGAAIVVDQDSIGAPVLAAMLIELLSQPAQLAAMRESLANWQPGDAAQRIVDAMFSHRAVKRQADGRSQPSREAGESRPLPPLQSSWGR